MRRVYAIATTLLVGAAAAAAATPSAATGGIAASDSASVASATVMASMMKEQVDYFRSRGIEINDAVFIDAFAKQFNGQSTGMTVQEADAYMGARFRALDEAAHPTADPAVEKAFMDSVSVLDGAIVTPSGLVFLVISEGEGTSPGDNDMAMVDYTGRLSDGSVFDSSRGQVVELPVSGLIPGFTEGLKMMKPGGEYRIIIPASLGYGSGGSGPIPGNAALDFTVRLEGVKAN